MACSNLTSDNYKTLARHLESTARVWDCLAWVYLGTPLNSPSKTCKFCCCAEVSAPLLLHSLFKLCSFYSATAGGGEGLLLFNCLFCPQLVHHFAIITQTLCAVGISCMKPCCRWWGLREELMFFVFLCF
jgi:hypothetical protein